MTTEDTEQSFVGCGLYTLSQAARLLRVPQNSLRYWMKPHDKLTPIVPNEIANSNILTFPQLMEFHFVKMFLDAGVSFQAIRKASKSAAAKFHVQYPFTVKRFDTDGRTIFATLQKDEKSAPIVEDLQRGQLVFQKIIRPFFKKLDYGTVNDIQRFWPMQKRGRVVLDPLRKFGQPIDSESGVPTEALFRAVSAGDGQDVKSVANWFDVPLEAVKAAVRFERSLRV